MNADGDLPRVAADLDKVRQVLVNLVENAIKYSPDGGRVEVGAEAHDQAIRFHVRDEGLGIDPEEQERIFEKFYRADPADAPRRRRHRASASTSARSSSSRMGGSIWVESNEEKGSVFVFELPTADVVAHGGSGAGRLHFKN